MVVRIGGQLMYLWRAVDDEGEVLEVLVQRRRDKAAEMSPFPGQICGFAKLGSGPCHAANLMGSGVPW